MQSENEPPKVMNCCSDPSVTLGGGAVTEGNKRRLLTVPSPSQPQDLTASAKPPRVAKEVLRAPPGVKISLCRVNFNRV